MRWLLLACLLPAVAFADDFVTGATPPPPSTLANLQGAVVDNVVLGNATPAWAAAAIANCAATDRALNYSTGTHSFSCQAALNATQLLGATWASPAAIGTGTPASGAFTTLSATTPIAEASGGTGAGALTCTNQFLTSNGTAQSCSTPTLAGAQFANQGSTTTLLHGNGSGNPAFSGVALADFVANLGTTTQVLHGNAAGQPTYGAIVSADVSTVLASPPAIGGSAAAAGTFTALTAGGSNNSVSLSTGTAATTVTSTAATARAGLRNANTRNITSTTSVSPVDCAAGALNLTVTQFLDADIFTCATAQTITLPTWQGASGTVQALPGAPAIGDVIEFNVCNTAAATATTVVTLAAGTGGTLGGGSATVGPNTCQIVQCRLTNVTASSETATCYNGGGWNPAVPPAIGGTTPAAGTFTTLTTSTGLRADNIDGNTGALSVNSLGGANLNLGQSSGTTSVTIGRSGQTTTVSGSLTTTSGNNPTVTMATGTSAMTISSTAATTRAGLRHGGTRWIAKNNSVAPTDCAGATLNLTVTQLLDGNIATCATAQTINFPTWQGASGTVQALPGAPAVGDLVGPFIFVATAANALTIGLGTGGTSGGANLTVAASTTRTWWCRLTNVTGNSEAATCY